MDNLEQTMQNLRTIFGISSPEPVQRNEPMQDSDRYSPAYDEQGDSLNYREALKGDED